MKHFFIQGNSQGHKTPVRLEENGGMVDVVIDGGACITIGGGLKDIFINSSVCRALGHTYGYSGEEY